MENISLIYGVVALICSALLAYAVTPPVRVFAYKIGALDIPTDGRRMHSRPIPRLGGLAIFVSFLITSLIFCEPSPTLYALWFGGIILVTLGTLDDIFRLHWVVKILVQFGVAGIAVSQGIVIDQINIGGTYISFGAWSIPLSLVWIAGLTNAINFIDGLDGLACGVSAICSLSLLFITLLRGDVASALLTAILAGSCIGFLPFNRNPARIFMGDTGALFLGYTLAILSIEGVFKLHTILSFAMPLSIFALPLLDAATAIIRRVLHKKSPFEADRGHLHHKLVDLGFTQREAVGILYAICGILGLVAVTFTEEMFPDTRFFKSLCLAGAALLIFTLNFIIMKHPSSRYLSGIFDMKDIPPEHLAPRDTGAASAEPAAEAAEAEAENAAEADTPPDGGLS